LLAVLFIFLTQYINPEDVAAAGKFRVIAPEVASHNIV
jgi:hypothetical protein